MPRIAKSKNASNNQAANLGFEAKLWLTADKLRNNMDAAEYKHLVLGNLAIAAIPTPSPFCATRCCRSC